MRSRRELFEIKWLHLRIESLLICYALTIVRVEHTVLRMRRDTPVLGRSSLLTAWQLYNYRQLQPHPVSLLRLRYTESQISTAMNDRITFNIIFLPGTVHALAPFVISLLDSSDECSFRLVSNGCTTIENNSLRAFAATDDRLDFCQIATRRQIAHGAALSKLQKMESSPFFAFMDSDIFATGQFLNPTKLKLGSNAATFSCPPIWSNAELETLPEGYGVLSGVYNRLHDGFCVGSSYFGIYDNERLTQCIRDTGVSFQIASWTGLSQLLRAELASAGKQIRFYDTGKLLNVLLQVRYGHAIEYQKIPQLEHIGGFSSVATAEIRDSLLTKILSPSKVISYLARFVSNPTPEDWRPSAGEVEFHWVEERHDRRRRTCQHFTGLLERLCNEERPLLDFEDQDDKLTADVKRVAAILCDRYPEWLTRYRFLTQTHLPDHLTSTDTAQLRPPTAA